MKEFDPKAKKPGNGRDATSDGHKTKLQPVPKDKYGIVAQTEDDDDDSELNLFGDAEEPEEDWQSYLANEGEEDFDEED